MCNSNINLFNLNDDCLIKIFINCDVNTLLSLVDTCHRFNDIIQKFIFPKISSFHCVISYDTNLKTLHRIAINIAKFLKSLTIDVDLNNKKHLNVSTYAVIHQFEKLATNLQVLRFKSTKLTVPWLTVIISLITNSEIETLMIQTEYFVTNNCIFDVIEPFTIENVKHFLIQGNFDLKIFSPNSLESIAIDDNCELEHEAIVKFMHSSSQLKRFKMFEQHEMFVWQIVSFLPNLEELILFKCKQKSELSALKQLEKLRNLRIMQIDWNIFNFTIFELIKLKNISSLKIQMINDPKRKNNFSLNKISFISIAHKLNNLTAFSIAYCPLDAQTLIDFLNYAFNLEVIHIHDCSVELNEDIVRSIGRVRTKALKIYSNNFDPSVTEQKQNPRND